MAPSDYWLDPDIEFEGTAQYLLVTVSVLALLFAVVAMFGG